MDEEKKFPKVSLVQKMKNFGGGLWTVSAESEHGFKRAAIVFARIVFAVVNGIIKKRIMVQASSLSYATLLAVGPILAITIMFSQLFFRDKDEAFFYDKIMDAATFVMPAFNEMLKEDAQHSYEVSGTVADSVSADSSAAGVGASAESVKGGGANAVGNGAAPDAAHAATAAAGSASGKSLSGASDGAHVAKTRRVVVNPRVYEFISNISKGSAKAGIFGVVAMLFTCLLLFVNMESAFNYIWGVEQGRNWINRIVFYFVMIFFGSVGSIFAAGFFATSTLARLFGNITFIREYLPWISYGLGVSVMLAVLSCFYKFIPFTKVGWKAALVGGAVVTLLLLLNNRGSFLYISYIAKQQSFYGYLAIVVIAMFSLYIFWIFLLSGGMIAYSVQFVGFYDDAHAWNKIGSRAKRMCALAVFCEVCKDFYNAGSGAKNLDELTVRLKLPSALLAMCVRWLCEKRLICFAEIGDDTVLKPSVAPDTMTVARLLEILSINDGDDLVFERLSGYENAVKISLSTLQKMDSDCTLSKTVKELI